MNITFIIRGRGEGKTTAFLELYHRRLKEGFNVGFGFYQRKKFDSIGRLIGYDLCTIDGRRSWPLATIEPHESYHKQGRWFFNLAVFDHCMAIIKSSRQPSCLWLDEVGKLELDGLGFRPVIDYAVAHDVDMVITVRTQYANAVKSKFGLNR